MMSLKLAVFIPVIYLIEKFSKMSRSFTMRIKFVLLVLGFRPGCGYARADVHAAMTAKPIPGPRNLWLLYRIRYFFLAVAALMLFSFTIGAAFAMTMPGEAQQVMKLISAGSRT